MSKGLQALRQLKRDNYGTREAFDNKLSIIEKELKALEIIKKYISMNRAFKNLANKESCNLTLVEIKALIPDEEYEQIKEVLK